MPTWSTVRAFLVGALAVATLACATMPASTDSCVDQRANTCRPGGGIACAYGLVVTSWHRSRSSRRTVSWVYATRSPASTNNLARW
ncbi:hypothetical protein [Streptomyces sp. WM6378]|uniref:hypothetical protein n=1 Tax=Streptomyces sp. WM6378 TaxID=1415557 RepID=UPI0006AFBF09|nr:hypothetical protein [Streptomyces sp. WM6378]KOU36325.1 hypothetical protein ADK54_34050 [Streptomyces sp. WM6378]